MQRSIFAALVALATATAAGQETPRPDPADPRVKVPGVEYRSAFAGFRPFAEEKVAPWRESNEAAKDARSHGGDAPPSAEKSRPAPKPPPGGEHGGHR